MSTGIGLPREGVEGQHKGLDYDEWWPDSPPFVDGVSLLFIFILLWIAAWLALFYFLRWLQPIWMDRWQNSYKQHENDPNWCARNALGIVHAVLVAAISLPALVIYLPAPTQAKFGASYHLADCSLEKSQSDILHWDSAGRATALAGLAFVSYTIADLILSYLHCLSRECQWLHHGTYITAGLLIRFHCMLPFNALMLMCMEASTPFLNYSVLFRHRDPAHEHSGTLNICTTVFLLTFVLFRLILNTYGAIFLCVNYKVAIPPWVPLYQYWLLMIAIVVGALMQYNVVPILIEVVKAGLRRSRRKLKERVEKFEDRMEA
jgi:hypothetical protein|mmetsp:Transcript_29683/g.47819  ORF Transcript_29683/g.47819 Transcript_29683/m.47819 type:complete len:319 (+) Transcript_29683:83-1039(+)